MIPYFDEDPCLSLACVKSLCMTQPTTTPSVKRVNLSTWASPRLTCVSMRLVHDKVVFVWHNILHLEQVKLIKERVSHTFNIQF